MAVLNVTPDSFSDGGRWNLPEDAVARGLELVAQGAHIVDVGGESTRPGAQRVPVEIEQERVLPVIAELAKRGVVVSVDTMNSSTAIAAAAAGASFVNDVSGGLADPEMYRAIAQTGVRYVVSHWRGHSATMDQQADYQDVVAEVRAELKTRVAQMLVSGVPQENIVLDPGLGFAKTGEHNWRLLARLDTLASLGFPLLIGASRKRFIGELLASARSTSASEAQKPPMAERDAPTAVISALAAQAGVWGVRVHDVPSTRLALDVVASWQRGASA